MPTPWSGRMRPESIPQTPRGKDGIFHQNRSRDLGSCVGFLTASFELLNLWALASWGNSIVRPMIVIAASNNKQQEPLTKVATAPSNIGAWNSPFRDLPCGVCNTRTARRMQACDVAPAKVRPMCTQTFVVKLKESGKMHLDVLYAECRGIMPQLRNTTYDTGIGSQIMYIKLPSLRLNHPISSNKT